MMINEDCLINLEEVFVVRQGEEAIAIWNGDVISLKLKDESKYQGCVGWSIDPFYLTLSETKGSITTNYNFAWRTIEEIDILEYSSKRPKAETQSCQKK